MAGEGGERVEVSDHESRQCMACRGTGRVISNLGGSQSLVSCPWCEGSGVRRPGSAAQAHWSGQQGAPSAEPQGSEPGETQPPADG